MRRLWVGLIAALAEAALWWVTLVLAIVVIVLTKEHYSG